jgi:uncharacterized membrane protein YgcG
MLTFPGTERCRICSNLISGDYFRINGQMACSNCAQQAQAGQPTDSHAAFLRGLLLASGGAVVGLILYSTVAIATGWTIGYLALAVGWLVGKGMIKGSNGLGGRRYQIAAVLLTYAAISLAAVPVGIAEYIKNPDAIAAKGSADGSSSSGNDSADSPSGSQRTSGANLGALSGQLLLWGLASPFLEFTASPGSAAIGLFILFIGLRIAWTMTRAHALAVDGPYSATAP